MRTLLAIRFSILLSCVVAANAQAQQELHPQIKAGGMIYFVDRHYNGGSFHLEYEFPVGRSKFLTNGPRLDYIHPATGPGTLLLGYELKGYPLAAIMERPFQGLFIGVDPVFLVPDNNHDPRSGPGLGAVLGYQQMLGNRFSLSVEASSLYLKDVNEESTHHGYWYAFACVKVGFKL